MHPRASVDDGRVIVRGGVRNLFVHVQDFFRADVVSVGLHEGVGDVYNGFFDNVGGAMAHDVFSPSWHDGGFDEQAFGE